MDDGPWKKILLAVGTLSVAVGTYLPWLRTNPNLPPDTKIPTVYYTGMNAGLEGFDFTLLGAVGLALLIRAISLRTEARTATVLAVGLGMLVFPAYYLSNFTLAGFSAVYVPALGWYLTILGGVLFTITGGFELLSIIRWPGATTRPRD